VYKLQVRLPEDWKKNDSIIDIDLDDDDDINDEEDQFTILLHGVESACFVYCNGELLGFFKDSRLPSEFQLPVLAVKRALLSDNDDDEPLVLHFVVAR
jgi:beta-galactosidase/beta-glucuronidase